jgi:hypothetical protein
VVTLDDAHARPEDLETVERARGHLHAFHQLVAGGRRHGFEAEMRERRRTPGAPRHDATP